MCNVVRICLLLYFSIFLTALTVAFVWQLQNWYALFAPAGIIIVIFIVYCYYTTSYGDRVRYKLNEIVELISSTDNC